MRKIKIYIDTSVINYLVATRLPEKMSDSLALWEIFASGEPFDVVVSDAVNRELRACYEPKKTQLLEGLSGISHSVIEDTPEVAELANRYVEFGVLHPKHYFDLLHIAYATVSRCKLIVSWNFKHFVNFKTMDRVNAVNLVEGYDPIRIVSPSMLLGEIDHER